MTNSTGNRTAEALRNIPPTTGGIIGICVFLHIGQNLLGWDLQLFTMCPKLVLFQKEFYRVFSSAVYHANMMHIGMNMLSTSAIGSALEKRMGTMGLLLSIWWALLLASGIYLVLAYAAFEIFGYQKWMYQHSVGFSGILFHLSVLESRLHSGSRSVFGAFSVPVAVYPWVLLVFLQIFMPNLSFLGHLSGILSGTLESHGCLNCLLVSDSYLLALESWPILRPLTSLNGFVPTTPGQRFREESSLVHFVGKAFGSIAKGFSNVFETLLVCVCGRNCQLPDLRFWRRQSSNEIECGVIRPPEFYEGGAWISHETCEENDESEPLTSQMV